MRTFDEAKRLGFDVLMWAQTRRTGIEVVLLREKKNGRYLVCCADAAGFFQTEQAEDFNSARLAFNSKLDFYGACDVPTT